MTDALTAALEYAERGWPVFPLRPRSKAPAFPSAHPVGDPLRNKCKGECGKLGHGFHDAVTDEDTIRQWWSKDRGVGVAIPEGYWVLDVDPRNGGDESFSLIRDQVPTTREAITGGGGTHLWFKGDAPTTELPGIDIKVGGKGYVVMPPSIHPETGDPYRWNSVYDKERPIREFSGPLTVPGSSDTPQDFWAALEGSGGLSALALSDDPIPLGEQHDTLVQIAGHVLSTLPVEAAEYVYRKRVADCDPAHPEAEADRIWQWVLERQAMGDGLVGAPMTEDARQEAVEREVEKLQIREDAKRLMRERKALAEWSAVRDDVPFKSLRERLDEFDPDEQVEFVVEDLLATYGNVVFSAQDKAGKTTFSLSLVKALVDGGQYLNRFETKPVERNVCYMNVELAAHTADKWFADLEIENAHKVQTLYLRGREQWFAIESPEVRRHVADALKSRDIGVLIIDPIGPLWDAAGINENENSEVGPYMVTLGQLAVAANIDNLIVVQHAGHGGERARGASKILGWPDAVWSIRKATEGAEERRFFKAYGRDVKVDEAPFTYDHETREVTLMSPDEVAARKTSSILDSITDAVRLEPGIKSGDLRKAIAASNAEKTRWLDSALADGLIHSHPGPQNSRLYFSGLACPDGCG